MHIQFINDSQFSNRFNRKCFPFQGRLILHYNRFIVNERLENQRLDQSIDFEWYIKSRFCHARIELENGKLLFSISIPPISLWISFENYKWAYANREISFGISDWSLHWKLWADTMGWSNKTPRYRDGWFNILDFILGKKQYSETIIEEKEVLIPMPEHNYEAKIQLREDVWKRKRWFSKRIVRCDIDIPGGIPHEGKGENSWDCGIDGIFGLCCPAKSIPDAVGKVVGMALEERIKNGGWVDYVWNKESSSRAS